MMLWMDTPFYWPLMTLVEVKGDIGVATLVHDLDLIQGISPDLDGLLHQAGVLPILLIYREFCIIIFNASIKKILEKNPQV